MVEDKLLPDPSESFAAAMTSDIAAAGDLGGGVDEGKAGSGDADGRE